jgi:hypothetical protein
MPGMCKAAADNLEKHIAVLTDCPRAVTTSETFSGKVRILIINVGRTLAQPAPRAARAHAPRKWPPRTRL